MGAIENNLQLPYIFVVLSLHMYILIRHHAKTSLNPLPAMNRRDVVLRDDWSYSKENSSVEETKQIMYEYVPSENSISKKMKAGEVDLKRQDRVVCLMIPNFRYIYIYIWKGDRINRRQINFWTNENEITYLSGHYNLIPERTKWR